MRLLLVEDDRMLGAAMQQSLRDAAHAVDWVRDAEAAQAALAATDYEALLLDLGLPGRDGIEVLRAVRAAGNDAPVLIVTARDAVDERIRGLDLGADDVLVKPFEPGELLARLRAITRRKAGHAHPLLGNGVLSLDPRSHQVSVGGAEPVHLSAREYALLHALLLRPGVILSRAELEERIYGWTEEVGSNAVEFLIRSLRKKLGASAIRNVRGIGWMVDRDPERDEP